MTARFVVEFEVDDPMAFTPMYDGDAAIDFFNRAFGRVLRGALNEAMGRDPRIRGWYRLGREEREVAT